MKLVLIRGIPGSGKSTYASKNYGNIVSYEQDQYFMRDGKYKWNAKEMPNAVAWCFNAVKNALENGMDVVVANTFVKAAHVAKYEKLAKSLGASFEVIRMANDFGNVHSVPQFVIDNMKANFQDWPSEKIATA